MRVHVFGAIRLVDADGVEHVPPSPSQRRILAALAAQAGQPIRGERLCDLLEISPGTLRTTVSRLRKFLGPDVIVNDAAGYRIVAGSAEADELEATARSAAQASAAAAVEQRAVALATVTGSPYEEFAHEPWARPEVARLDELLAEMTEAHASSLFLLDRHDEGVQLMVAHTAAYPYRDQARALLMEGLARTGRQVEALRAYEDYRALLAEEAGAVPSSELQELSNEIAIGEMSTTVGAVGATGATGRVAEVVDVTDNVSEPMVEQDLVAYLVTDLVGSTRIRVELGDRAATPLLAAAEELQRTCVAEFRGQVAQGTGDGIAAWFASITDAIEAMLSMGQRIADLGPADGSGPGVSGTAGEGTLPTLSLRGVVDVGDVDWDGSRPIGPLVDRVATTIDAIVGDDLACSELAAVLVASGEFDFAPGPLPGLVSPQRQVAPAR